MQARTTVVVQVSHSAPDVKTSGTEPVRFSRYVESDEQPFKRTITLTAEWQTLDVGWLTDKGCSILVLQNVTRRQPSKRPTDEELDAFDEQIIEYGVRTENGDVGLASLLPEEGVPLTPLEINKVIVRSVKGAKLSYFVVPK